MAWKLDPKHCCTTNIVPGAFTEGCAEWEHYADDKWKTVSDRALIFDSEMLHRGGKTIIPGFTHTLTMQVSSGTGWPFLKERVSESLMWYTQPLGWQEGDAVDALWEGKWYPGIVDCRTKGGLYRITLDEGDVKRGFIKDSSLRYREATPASLAAASTSCFFFSKDATVEGLYDGKWFAGKVVRRNKDDTYRVIWSCDRSFTDGIPGTSLRKAVVVSAAAVSPKKTGGLKRQASDGLSESDDRPAASSKRSKTSENDSSPSAMRARLFSPGLVELSVGLPEDWRSSSIFDFMEAYHDRFHVLVCQELEALRDFWTPIKDSGQRHGAFAAAKVSERLKPYGLAIYSPGPSQQERQVNNEYKMTGPRWYISITQAALDHYGIAPALPAGLHDIICGHPADQQEECRARGLGWTLAPPGSDPQALHADIWGSGAHARTDRTFFPHLLWKRDSKQLCTTQMVPDGFTQGQVEEGHYKLVKQVAAPAVIVDSEALHRGAPTASHPKDSRAPVGWANSLSLEFCTPSGWAAWEAYETGGTSKDPSSALDWTMLKFALAGKSPSPKDETCRTQSFDATKDIPKIELPPAPWAGRSEDDCIRLMDEQTAWEMSG